MPFFSICIPAYKNPKFLKRLLDSIVIQSFKDYEVIVTDDSEDESVSLLISHYQKIIPLFYQHNFPPQGSPANWNCSIRLAKGKWIKIMHDDDWFSHHESLEFFFRSASNSTFDFIFCGYHKINLTNNHNSTFILSKFNRWLLQKYPLILFKDNFIGHPSNTLFRNGLNNLFDEKTHWVVDFEFYIRAIEKSKGFIVIYQPLISIGISDEQITNSSFRNKEIEIPEFIYLLNKYSNKILKNIFVFDQYWRLLRNLEINSLKELKIFSKEYPIPPALINMAKYQNIFNKKVLKFGIISKFIMATCYFMIYVKGELE